MKKIIILIVILVVLAGMFAIMINNKKNNDTKAKSVEVMNDVPVSTTKVTKDKAQKELSIIGVTAPNAEVNVIAEVTGKVMEIKPQIGDIVSKGSVIAKIDDELKVASFNLAEANYEKAKKDMERYEVLYKEKSVNDVQYEQVKLNVKVTESQYIIAKKQLTDCKIIAPITGMVIARPAEIGTVLTQQNQNIVSLIEVGTMKVKINVPEKDVFLMKVGDEVEVKTDMNQESYKGRIKAIVAKGDEAHTYPVEIAIQNKGSQQLKSGMFVRVNFSKIIKNEVLLIPRASLVGSVKDAKVYLVEGESVKLVPVIVGSEIGTNLEIVSGLSEGQNIVINGQLNLVDGSKIKIVK